MKESFPLEQKSNDEVKINRVVVFTIVALSLLMTTIDSTIVATALDTLQKGLNTTINWAGWTLTAYSLGFVLMLPLSAKLSQQFGPRKVFLFSVATFAITSLLCGFSINIYMLIVLRFFQAMGAAGITPSVTAIIVDHFGSARDRAVSLFGSIFPIGVMIGPIFGGLFVTYWSWEWIFFVNVPIGLLVIILSLKFIPKDEPHQISGKQKMDKTGIALLALGILGAMFAATYLGEKETKAFSFEFLGLCMLAFIGIVGFFIHIKKVDEPFIKPRFIYGKGFGAVNFINTLYGGTIMGVISLLPFYAASRYGLNPLNSGTLLIAQGAASVILSTIMSLLLRRTGYRLPLYIGCSFMMLGTLLLAFPPAFEVSAYWWLAGCAFLIGIGMGTISPPTRNAGLQLAPEESATIAALRSLGLQLGSIISIAVVTAILASADKPSEVQAHVFIGIAVIFVLALPAIRGISEHKGAW